MPFLRKLKSQFSRRRSQHHADQELAQFLFQGLEDRQVFVELGDQAVDGVFRLLQQLALLRERARLEEADS